MADRSTTAPAHLFRWLIAPAAAGAIGATIGAALRHAASMVRRRARQPQFPRMSEEWLKNLDKDSGRRLDYWRDSW